MAKKYLDLFRGSAETAYGSGAFPLMALSQSNKGIKFAPVAAQGDTANTATQFTIQRMKRGKASEVVDKTGKVGDDVVSLMNQAQKVEWDSIATKTSKKSALIFNVSVNESMDVLEDASAFSGVINDKTKNRLAEGEEKAIAKVASKGTGTITPDGTLDLTDAAKAVKDIQDAIYSVEELVDDFKAYSDNTIVIVHPRVAEVFAKLQGQAYQTGSNTFGEGFQSSFRYNGYDFFVSKPLNAIESATSGNVVGAIVMDSEAYANAGLTEGLTSFDQTYLDERVIGHTYRDLDIVVDPSRVKVFDFTNAKSKKVNE